VARPLRILVPGGLYHLIARGNARAKVFLDEFDFAALLELAAKTVQRFGWICHAYCLLDNHYHLVVETPRPNLPLGMRQLNGVYAQRFNRRYNRCGHVFQARYRSILVEKETHLLSVCRYVVLNPVRAGSCDRPGDYRWSSYAATVGTTPAEPLLTTDWILAQFGGGRATARARYRAFVADGIGKALDVRGERVGAEAFLRDRLGHEPPLAEIPRSQIEPLRPPLAELFATAELPIATAHRQHDYRLREIAGYLGCHYSTVSRRLTEEEGLLDRQRKT
jgi:putative transposase